MKEKCSPFNQCIIQQPIMSINKVITPMTELSDPPSYNSNDWRQTQILLMILTCLNTVSNMRLPQAIGYQTYTNVEIYLAEFGSIRSLKYLIHENL